MSEKQAKLFLS